MIVIAGSEWYESKARGLGEEFTRLFYVCAAEIPRDPLIYQRVFGGFRRCLLRRFPYAIYYKVIENEVVVFGFFIVSAIHEQFCSTYREEMLQKTPFILL